MSGKLPGAKQQFRIPFCPEPLEQPSFSVFVCLSLLPVSLLVAFPPLPSFPPPPFTPARDFPLMARRSTQPDLVALVACTPSSCPVSLPSRRHSKMDKPRADSAPCLRALAKTERRKFDRISFVPPSLLIRFISFFFGFSYCGQPGEVLRPSSRSSCNCESCDDPSRYNQWLGHSLHKGNDIIICSIALLTFPYTVVWIR
jgi:hypothetical protein